MHPSAQLAYIDHMTMTTEELKAAQLKLTEKQRKFVELWLVHRNAHYAYIHAYDAKRMNPATSYREGHRLTQHPKIAPILTARLAELGEDMSEETGFTIERALSDFLTLVNADPDEVSGMRTGACRHCWGEGHGYQWKEHEYLEAVAKAEKAEQELPDPAGGFGYRFTAPINPDCPICEGTGAPYQVPVDTSKLSPGGKMLFDGVKPTANGLEYKIRDRGKAMESAAKIIGAFTEKIDLRVKGSVDTSKVTPENAAEIYKEMLK